MGDVLKESIGRDVIEMLAGHKDMDGKKFVPADDERKKTQAAAEYLSKTPWPQSAATNPTIHVGGNPHHWSLYGKYFFPLTDRCRRYHFPVCLHGNSHRDLHQTDTTNPTLRAQVALCTDNIYRNDAVYILDIPCW